MKNTKLIIPTNQGELKVEHNTKDKMYPGIKIYMNDLLVGIIEVYEKNNLLKGHLYNDKENEPIVSETLIDFNE